ncbi:MAG: hypothetical protein OXG44_00200 [Gammaproteobacteria bacterium]|nr:hypothetical protein [Gammaproteobacteria bacterium]
MRTTNQELVGRIGAGAAAGGAAAAGMAAAANSLGWTSAIETTMATHGTTVGIGFAVAIAVIGQLVIHAEGGRWRTAQLLLGGLAGAAITGAMFL